MKLEPYLTLGGLEIANSLRTLSYLRVLGHPAQPTLQYPLPFYEGLGYSDLYSDLYGSDPYVVGNLGCYCSVLDTGPYARPSYDPAPWYDPDRPESDDFLGLRLDLELVPAAKRPVTPLVRGGASVGAVTYGVRVLQATGEAYAMSRAGMEYGERWLARALLGSAGCGDDVAVILPTCPPDDVDDPDGYLRELAGIGVVDGPVFTVIDAELP
ncbi:MAG TPA: hypothetical protein VFA96_07160, partial [Nocardioides sp.]|nr:hypothetical protein [Nocardioides sp.]